MELVGPRLHQSRAAECPLLGVKRTSRIQSGTSAFDSKRNSFTFAVMHNGRFCGDKLRGVAHASV
jgi:hypothetical protein